MNDHVPAALAAFLVAVAILTFIAVGLALAAGYS